MAKFIYLAKEFYNTEPGNINRQKNKEKQPDFTLCIICYESIFKKSYMLTKNQSKQENERNTNLREITVAYIHEENFRSFLLEESTSDTKKYSQRPTKQYYVITKQCLSDVHNTTLLYMKFISYMVILVRNLMIKNILHFISRTQFMFSSADLFIQMPQKWWFCRTKQTLLTAF